MFVKTVYLGCYPLGGDLKINGIKIMQSEWKKIRKPIVFPFGKRCEKVIPFFCETFVVMADGKRAFFLACESGIGKYHIFGLSEKANQKLCDYKRLKTQK
ncbi:MAG: hypothetical protein E7679_05855 [Ruminococcaceae bacterium]|nr:hypothetical protein [Oscillospiraceae bacterium]